VLVAWHFARAACCAQKKKSAWLFSLLTDHYYLRMCMASSEEEKWKRGALEAQKEGMALEMASSGRINNRSEMKRRAVNR